MPDAGRFTILPLMTIDTHLATRPGFGTPAFTAFREMLQAFSDIGDGDDATE